MCITSKHTREFLKKGVRSKVFSVYNSITYMHIYSLGNVDFIYIYRSFQPSYTTWGVKRYFKYFKPLPFPLIFSLFLTLVNIVTMPHYIYKRYRIWKHPAHIWNILVECKLCSNIATMYKKGFKGINIMWAYTYTCEGYFRPFGITQSQIHI